MSASSVVGEAPPAVISRRPQAAGHFLSRFGIVAIFIVLFVLLSLASPTFFSERNLLNILTQNSTVGIIACGAAFVIISGGFDLSVAATFAAAGIVTAYAAQSMPLVPAFVLGILTGLVIGLLNGFVIVLFGVNSFIATLATSFIIRGVCSVITDGYNITVLEDGFGSLGNGVWFGVPVPVYLLVITVVVFTLLLSRTRFGRYVFASGGNSEAARMSGVRVDRMRVIAFGLSGLCAGVAGVISTSRVGAGQAGAGDGIELTVVAAIVVGGISIAGGEGSIPKAILGVLLIALIGNGFTMLNLDTFYQSIAQGAIILIAVAADTRSGGLIHGLYHRFRRAVTARTA